MKKLMIGFTLAVMAASPAFAQMAGSSGARELTQVNRGYAESYGAYAYAPVRAPDYNGPQAVFADGQYQGSDPDPFIRFELRRETLNGVNAGGY